MSFETAVGTFRVGTGVATTQYSVTGKTPTSGTWKAVILWWSGRTETTDASGEQHISPGIGVAVSGTSRWAAVTGDQHGAANVSNYRYYTDANCIALVVASAGGTIGRADFTQFNSDGFTVDITEQFNANTEVSYLLLGGDDLTNVAAGSTTLVASLGNSDYSITAFQPDFMLFANPNDTVAPPHGVAGMRLGIGAAVTGQQGVLAIGSVNGAADSLTSSYCFSGAASGSFEMFAHVGSTPNTDAAGRVSFVQFNADGVRLNRLEGTGTLIFPWLALKGGNYSIGNFLTPTNTNAFTEAHGMAVTPKAAMFFSANRTASTQDAATPHMEWSVGASDGTVNTCQCVRSKDASAAADDFASVSHDECYQNADNSATQVLEGEGHVTSFDATNINLQMTDADPAQSFVWYVAFGDAVATSPVYEQSAYRFRNDDGGI